jgi:hypothetical protein
MACPIIINGFPKLHTSCDVNDIATVVITAPHAMQKRLTKGEIPFLSPDAWLS